MRTSVIRFRHCWHVNPGAVSVAILAAALASLTRTYKWVDRKINAFRDDVMTQTMVAANLVIVLVTGWMIYQGFRILTTRAGEPLMALNVNTSRNALILIAAGTMAIGGADIQVFFTDTMASGIGHQ